MLSTLHFLLSVIILRSATVEGDESAICKIWSDVEHRLRDENFIITCTTYNSCYSLNCSGSAHGYNIYSSIQLHACENPPNIEFEVNVPKLRKNNIKKRIYHNDSIPLTKNLNIEFEVERLDQNLVLGVFVHYLNNGSFPLLRIPMRVPVISHLSFPVDCFQPKDSTKNSTNMSRDLSFVSSTPTKSFLVANGDDNEYSNCSVINSTCAEEEICQQISKLRPNGICVCISNYTRSANGKCIPGHAADSSSVSLLLTAILVPIFVVLTIVALVYASIRFRVFQHLRRRLRVQVYEHVLLGEEDDEEDMPNPVA